MDRGWLLTLLVLLLIWDLYRLYRYRAIRKWLRNWRHPSQLPKPRVMKPKSELDCPDCQAEKINPDPGHPFPPPLPWDQQIRRGGRKKHIATQGYFCPNPKCEYYTVADEQVHALVGDGKHGKEELIRDFYCQACHTKFTARRNTVLY